MANIYETATGARIYVSGREDDSTPGDDEPCTVGLWYGTAEPEAIADFPTGRCARFIVNTWIKSQATDHVIKRALAYVDEGDSVLVSTLAIVDEVLSERS